MNSPTRSVFSPTASRVTSIIPETSVVSPRSTSTRSGLESSIHSLQSKISILREEKSSFDIFDCLIR